MSSWYDPFISKFVFCVNLKYHKLFSYHNKINKIHHVVDCVWAMWDMWAECSKTCGGGVQVRTRKVEKREENGGEICNGLSTEQNKCNVESCPSGKFNSLCFMFSLNNITSSSDGI